MESWRLINWDNPAAKITPHFTVRDALWLNEWGRLATTADGLTDEIEENIYKAAQKLEEIRALIGKPIFVKSWYRPKAYNVQIGGATYSMHMEGLAVDWWTDVNGDGDKDGEDCDALKALLMPELERLQIRMENNGAGARWVHIDLKPVRPKARRFFKP